MLNPQRRHHHFAGPDEVSILGTSTNLALVADMQKQGNFLPKQFDILRKVESGTLPRHANPNTIVSYDPNIPGLELGQVKRLLRPNSEISEAEKAEIQHLKKHVITTSTTYLHIDGQDQELTSPIQVEYINFCGINLNEKQPSAVDLATYVNKDGTLKENDFGEFYFQQFKRILNAAQQRGAKIVIFDSEYLLAELSGLDKTQQKKAQELIARTFLAALGENRTNFDEVIFPLPDIGGKPHPLLDEIKRAAEAARDENLPDINYFPLTLDNVNSRSAATLAHQNAAGKKIAIAANGGDIGAFRKFGLHNVTDAPHSQNFTKNPKMDFQPFPKELRAKSTVQQLRQEYVSDNFPVSLELDPNKKAETPAYLPMTWNISGAKRQDETDQQYQQRLKQIARNIKQAIIEGKCSGFFLLQEVPTDAAARNIFVTTLNDEFAKDAITKGWQIAAEPKDAAVCRPHIRGNPAFDNLTLFDLSKYDQDLPKTTAARKGINDNLGDQVNRVTTHLFTEKTQNKQNKNYGKKILVANAHFTANTFDEDDKLTKTVADIATAINHIGSYKFNNTQTECLIAGDFNKNLIDHDIYKNLKLKGLSKPKEYSGFSTYPNTNKIIFKNTSGFLITNEKNNPLLQYEAAPHKDLNQKHTTNYIPNFKYEAKHIDEALANSGLGCLDENKVGYDEDGGVSAYSKTHYAYRDPFDRSPKPGVFDDSEFLLKVLFDFTKAFSQWDQKPDINQIAGFRYGIPIKIAENNYVALTLAAKISPWHFQNLVNYFTRYPNTNFNTFKTNNANLDALKFILDINIVTPVTINLLETNANEADPAAKNKRFNAIQRMAVTAFEDVENFKINHSTPIPQKKEGDSALITLTQVEKHLKTGKLELINNKSPDKTGAPNEDLSNEEIDAFIAAQRRKNFQQSQIASVYDTPKEEKKPEEKKLEKPEEDKKDPAFHSNHKREIEAIIKKEFRFPEIKIKHNKEDQTWYLTIWDKRSGNITKDETGLFKEIPANGNQDAHLTIVATLNSGYYTTAIHAIAKRIKQLGLDNNKGMDISAPNQEALVTWRNIYRQYDVKIHSAVVDESPNKNNQSASEQMPFSNMPGMR